MSKTSADDPGEAMVEMELFQTRFDNTEESVSEAVVSAVVTVTDEDPSELTPLYHAIDPDALDALFQSTQTALRRGDRCLQFTFEGHELTVNNHGVIVVEPLREDDI